MAWNLEEAMHYYKKQGAPRDQSALVSLLREIQQENNGSIPDLKVKAKQILKQNAYTRAELRRKLNQLKRFSERGIEKSMQTKGGYVLSRYEFENLKREKARVQRNISRELTRLETEKARVYGKEQVYTFAQMGDSRYLNFLARKENIKKEIRLDDLQAPVKKGQVVGSVSYFNGDKIIGELPVKAKETVEKAGYLSAWERI